MKRVLRGVQSVLSSRATVPVVCAFFLLLYVAIAFATDEALTTLVFFCSRYAILQALFLLLPLNCGVRLVAEVLRFRRRRRALSGGEAAPDVFAERVELPSCGELETLAHPLAAQRYRSAAGNGWLASWRGICVLPARLLYLGGMCCLFTGILVSLATRSSLRTPLVEGEPFAGGAVVRRVALSEGTGAILAQKLQIEVAGEGGSRVFGLYPPSRYRGAYVYPRYLALGLQLRLAGPDLPPSEYAWVLGLHPAGKEATQRIPGGAYRVVVSLVDPQDGSDPFSTGRMNFDVKLVKDKETVLAGRAGKGGEIAGAGYSVRILDARCAVLTDFVTDHGVPLIWGGMALLLLAAGLWLPIRFLLPRREMLFRSEAGRIVGYSRAEGRRKRHGELFREALDRLEKSAGCGAADAVSGEVAGAAPPGVTTSGEKNATRFD